ncbi:helix-turn-helix domain-containing protein [Sphaerobacter thermophilus]|jgi:hypothetical protein|uniref:Regulatory protein MerR n=1 Tax=Sphaerobacter thermophilus (strain ATCC 49802 / DSM 20745 / KCCM 41009 / NCIMB 13125 / S 6022) TaxID=479434 RepID=D1C6M0_SPHTD|nr:helix-turn-helix domain-containing protein [Sphaerobacter thermophilus]ACZ39645.1 regulatory protein MerR [Sphaerobacter thermophilus DSM 20745]PZN60299.1 MAG: DNA-binding protein [Sphaerobacter thermophilus]
MARVGQHGERVYTVGEVADVLQFHPDAIRYWLRVGELIGEPDTKPGEWRIRPEALVAFLRQNGETLPTGLPGVDAEMAMY